MAVANDANRKHAAWPGFRDGWTVWVVIRHVLQGRAVAPAVLLAPIDSGVYRVGVADADGRGGAGLVRLATAPYGWRRLTTLVLGMGLAWLLLFGPAVEHPTYVFFAALLNWALLEPNAPRSGRWVIVPAYALVVSWLTWGCRSPPSWKSRRSC